MNEKQTREWLAEFDTFLKTPEVGPPRIVSNAILSRVNADLNPALQLVAAKLFGLHAAATALVLVFCPQLGVGPVIGGHGIMHWFMHFGPLACAAACGALLLGISALFVTAFLRKEELRVANRHRVLNVAFLSSVSFAGLMLAGGQGDQATYLFWILGALVGGWFILRVGSRVRFYGISLYRS